ncbi:MAG: hypothetical protein M1330_05155 [Armatimonadetes bacterium]|nr:hypothetical protein [Armatimonadota bacterium]
MSLTPFIGVAVLESLIVIYCLRLEGFLGGSIHPSKSDQTKLTDAQVEASLENMDFETRQRIRYIIQLEREVISECTAKDVADYASSDLTTLAGQLSPLLTRAIQLAQKRKQLQRYLDNVDDHALLSYCHSLEDRIAKATDPVARSQLDQALKARQQEMETYQSIAQAVGRIDGQLENIEATMASWKAKIIRIKTAELASSTSVGQDLHQELSNLSSEVDMLDRSVREALEEETLITRYPT